MELQIYYYKTLLSLKIRPFFMKFLYYKNLEPYGKWPNNGVQLIWQSLQDLLN